MNIPEQTNKETRMKQGMRKVSSATSAYIAAPLPKSLDWLYGLGFKIGVFLALKSFLVVRSFHLSGTGALMVLSQLLMGMVLIVLGSIMQREGAMDNPFRLKKICRWYGFTAAFSMLLLLMKGWFSWDFFREAAARNWFLDFFNGFAKGMGEILLSLVFWDAELWTAFCFLLFLLSFVYLNLEQPESKIFRRLGARFRGTLPKAARTDELPG